MSPRPSPTGDIVSKAKRSEMMRAVGQRDTKPERAVRDLIRRHGVHYRRNHPGLPGRPDFANRSRGWAIFVHGGFWHGHRDCKKTKGGRTGRVPATNAAYWSAKIETNRERDERKATNLRDLGLRVLIVWECEIRDPVTLERKIGRFLEPHSWAPENDLMGSSRTFRVAGLFAGIGGIELGLSRAGHEAALLCENDSSAKAVLEARFPDTQVVEDVRALKKLPRGTNLLAAGFPCQDLSQAGETRGIKGGRSGLVGEVFRLLETHEVPWVLLENVPFMLRLGRGAAMSFIVKRLEEMGYKWAYRVMDTRAFGLPQRRERVYLLASREADPAPLLFKGDHLPVNATDYRGRACGFYWTEGVRGLGWAVGAVPTLKGGSTVGIPSPPALWLPEGRMVTPDIRDAERMQGFRANWTKPAENAGRASFRWKLVGNAVSVPVAKWIGDRLARFDPDERWDDHDGIVEGAWPGAAYNNDGCAFRLDISKWPVKRKQQDIQDFLQYELKDLSLRATKGFEKRLSSSTLRAPDEFRAALKQHIKRMKLQATT